MAQSGSRTRIVGLVLALLIVGAGGAWAWRAEIQAWYCVHQLARAGAAERETLAVRVVELGEAAVPSLLNCLRADDEKVCANIQIALDKLGTSWSVGDVRTAALLRQIGEQWPRLSDLGRRTALAAAARWVRALPADSEPAPGVVAAAGAILAAAAQGDAAVQAAGLALCDCLMTLPGAAAVRESAAALVRACLKAESAAVRLRTIQTSLRPGLDLAEQVAVLLADPAVEVRRAALSAVGPPDKEVPDETLLPCLHDADPEVRRLCEEALTEQRGLKPIHLKLGRLLTDPRFLVRIQVLNELHDLQLLEEQGKGKNPVDPSVWMCRLSHDPMPPVRAAAAWALAQLARDDCSRRLAEMARDDPSPTVCYLADYYRKQMSASYEPRP